MAADYDRLFEAPDDEDPPQQPARRIPHDVAAAATRMPVPRASGVRATNGQPGTTDHRARHARRRDDDHAEPTHRPAPVIAPPAQQRAVHAFTDTGVAPRRKPVPQRGWRRSLYRITRLNVGLSPDEQHESDLRDRVRRDACGCHQIAVLGLKGGAGKTSVTAALGSVLAEVRGDRILVVDADPGSGNLAERVGRQKSATIADLLAGQSPATYNDVRAFTSMNDVNLEVLPAEDYSSARRALTDDDWYRTVGAVGRFYNLVLADCGNDLFDAATTGVLSTVSGLVIVASASVDGARQAAVAMDWLRHNGYHDLLTRACVVINHVVPTAPNLAVSDIVRRIEPHVQPGRLVVLPWDDHIAGGTDIRLDLLGATYRHRVLELAAALSEDFDRTPAR